jgi:hypothetical protein
MIPLLAVVRVGGFRVWLPLFLVWLLLLPVVLLLSPVILVVCVVARVNPWRAFVALWDVMTGLSSTQVEIESPKGSMLIRLS